MLIIFDNGGESDLSLSTNLSRPSPSTAIATPSEVLVTNPFMLSSLASLYTKGLKPTPCTTPLIDTFRLSI